MQGIVTFARRFGHMSPTAHKIYRWTLILVVISAVVILSVQGFSYYKTPLEERFYHPNHAAFKPSGLYGHGLGIIGTLIILTGVFGYMARKRFKSLSRIGVLKYWLEFHIFLCTLGPVFVLFHTAFKFGGIVSIAFWSMVAVMLSGVIGRFIYNQIPRSIQGQELSLAEIRQLKTNLLQEIDSIWPDGKPEEIKRWIDQTESRRPGSFRFSSWFRRYFEDLRQLQWIGSSLKKEALDSQSRKRLIGLFKNELAFNRKIENLQWMQQLFRYWHVAHLPFAIIMLVIMIIHVIVTVSFGYTWIF